MSRNETGTLSAEAFEKFSLLGGPLHRLGCRLGLVRERTNTLRLGVALAALLWIGLMLMASIEGVSQGIFSVQLIGKHVRLLAVIPLFFLCESWIDPQMTIFVRMMVNSEVVPANSQPALESTVLRTNRLKDSWWPEVVCLITAVLASVFGSYLPLPGATSVSDPTKMVSTGSVPFLWFWIFCLTVFRFLIFRWLWRLGLWIMFLWRLSRLELHLVPTHPDNAAGLGQLAVVHSHFIPLVLAISAIQAASFAEELSLGTMTVKDVYPAMSLVLVIDAFLFLGPLLFFSPKLWTCRAQGLSDYMAFANSYVKGFDRKWLRQRREDQEPLLGTPDLQAMEGLITTIPVVQKMSWIPADRRLLLELLVAAVAPAIPLLLFNYPIGDLVRKFFERFLGL